MGREKKTKKKSIVMRVIISILVILTLLIGSVIGGGIYYANNLLSKVEKVEIVEEEIGIEPQVEEKLAQYVEVQNIALFGVDATDGNIGRSDSIMIATIDRNNKKLKLSSIMRDSRVNISGYGEDKINHAYAFGGPQLAIKTLNENFDLNIKDFVSVNFTNLPKIIDLVGGIELDIDSSELKYINNYINSNNGINGTKSSLLTKIGMQYVDGTQAMAYCRIRYTEGGDYKRTERHRIVLTKLFNKLISMSPTKYPSLLNEILPMVQTSLDTSEILDLANNILALGSTNLHQERFPVDGYCQGKTINGVYFLTFNKETTVNQIHDYLFEDIKGW